jgi:hypothetical protein
MRFRSPAVFGRRSGDSGCGGKRGDLADPICKVGSRVQAALGLPGKDVLNVRR